MTSILAEVETDVCCHLRAVGTAVTLRNNCKVRAEQSCRHTTFDTSDKMKIKTSSKAPQHNHADYCPVTTLLS